MYSTGTRGRSLGLILKVTRAESAEAMPVPRVVRFIGSPSVPSPCMRRIRCQSENPASFTCTSLSSTFSCTIPFLPERGTFAQPCGWLDLKLYFDLPEGESVKLIHVFGNLRRRTAWLRILDPATNEKTKYIPLRIVWREEGDWYRETLEAEEPLPRIIQDLLNLLPPPYHGTVRPPKHAYGREEVKELLEFIERNREVEQPKPQLRTGFPFFSVSFSTYLSY